MFHRQLMITGLRKQAGILQEILRDLEDQHIPAEKISDAYEARAALVAENLRQLREIQRHYQIHVETPCLS